MSGPALAFVLNALTYGAPIVSMAMLFRLRIGGMIEAPAAVASAVSLTAGLLAWLVVAPVGFFGVVLAWRHMAAVRRAPAEDVSVDVSGRCFGECRHSLPRRAPAPARTAARRTTRRVCAPGIQRGTEWPRSHTMAVRVPRFVLKRGVRAARFRAGTRADPDTISSAHERRFRPAVLPGRATAWHGAQRRCSMPGPGRLGVGQSKPRARLREASASPATLPVATAPHPADLTLPRGSSVIAASPVAPGTRTTCRRRRCQGRR